MVEVIMIVVSLNIKNVKILIVNTMNLDERKNHKVQVENQLVKIKHRTQKIILQTMMMTRMMMRMVGIYLNTHYLILMMNQKLYQQVILKDLVLVQAQVHRIEIQEQNLKHVQDHDQDL